MSICHMSAMFRLKVNHDGIWRVLERESYDGFLFIKVDADVFWWVEKTLTKRRHKLCNFVVHRLVFGYQWAGLY